MSDIRPQSEPVSVHLNANNNANTKGVEGSANTSGIISEPNKTTAHNVSLQLNQQRPIPATVSLQNRTLSVVFQHLSENVSLTLPLTKPQAQAIMQLLQHPRDLAVQINTQQQPHQLIIATQPQHKATPQASIAMALPPAITPSIQLAQVAQALQASPNGIAIAASLSLASSATSSATLTTVTQPTLSLHLPRVDSQIRLPIEQNQQSPQISITQTNKHLPIDVLVRLIAIQPSSANITKRAESLHIAIHQPVLSSNSSANPALIALRLPSTALNTQQVLLKEVLAQHPQLIRAASSLPVNVITNGSTPVTNSAPSSLPNSTQNVSTPSNDDAALNAKWQRFSSVEQLTILLQRTTPLPPASGHASTQYPLHQQISREPMVNLSSSEVHTPHKQSLLPPILQQMLSTLSQPASQQQTGQQTASAPSSANATTANMPLPTSTLPPTASDVASLLNMAMSTASPLQFISNTNSGNHGSFVHGLTTLLQVALSKQVLQQAPQLLERAVLMTPLLQKLVPQLGQLSQKRQANQFPFEPAEMLAALVKMGKQQQSVTNVTNDRPLQQNDPMFFVLHNLLHPNKQNIELTIRNQEERSATTNTLIKQWHLEMRFDLGEHGCMLSRAKLTAEQLSLELYADNAALVEKIKAHLPLFAAVLAKQGIELHDNTVNMGKIPSTLAHIDPIKPSSVLSSHA